MAKLRFDAIGLISRGADALAKRGDRGAAYSLYELANNLRLLMRGEAPIEEWNEVYVGADGDPLNIDALLPVETEEIGG